MAGQREGQGRGLSARPALGRAPSWLVLAPPGWLCFAFFVASELVRRAGPATGFREGRCGMLGEAFLAEPEAYVSEPQCLLLVHFDAQEGTLQFGKT